MSDLVERLRKDHDDLNCMAHEFGIKSDEEKAAEIARAMKDCWESANEIERLRGIEKAARALDPGWYGSGPEMNTTLYCEYCQSGHPHVDQINHKKDCPVRELRAALQERT